MLGKQSKPNSLPYTIFTTKQCKHLERFFKLLEVGHKNGVSIDEVIYAYREYICGRVGRTPLATRRGRGR